MLKRLFTYRGIRVRQFYLYIKVITFFVLLSPFLIGLGIYSFFYYQEFLLYPLYYGSLLTLVLLFLMIVLFMTQKQLFLSTVFFSRLDNLEVLARFLIDGGYYFSKKSNGKEKITLPKVYLKRDRYGLDVTFILRGNKFQDRFLRLGSQLEVMFDGDFMSKNFTKGFVTYSVAIDQFSGRINVEDVVMTDKGLKLMEDVYWNFNEQPHLLVAGGTGGGKTVTLMSIILGLAKIGHVIINDPKKSDFVGLKDIPVFQGHVYWEKADMVSCLENAVSFMNKRYLEMTKHPDYEAGKRYSAYGLKPIFIVFDEWAALMAELEKDYKTGSQVMEYVTQIVLKGRQAGVFMILAMQRPDGEYIKTALRDNFMKRLSVGHLEDTGYSMMFGDANRSKEFKKIDEIDGKKVYGRGYIANGGEIAREFYSPYVPFEKNFSFVEKLRELEPLEPINFSCAEAFIPLPERIDDVEEIEEVEEVVLTLSDFSDKIAVPPPQIRKLINLIEKLDYHSFSKVDGKYSLSGLDCTILENLFEKKEGFVGSWEELLIHYFKGE